jgi:hypothetical protein
MSRPRMRPRFTVPLPGDAEAARRRIRAALEADGCDVRGGCVGERVELRVPEEEQHYWSPHLSLVFDDDDGHWVARGRFGPHPHVWTMFLAIYAHVAFVGIGGAMYGISQWLVGQEPWALWALPLCAGVGALVYLSAFYGQGLGSDQMYRLRAFVERALEPEPPTEPPADAQG